MRAVECFSEKGGCVLLLEEHFLAKLHCLLMFPDPSPPLSTTSSPPTPSFLSPGSYCCNTKHATQNSWPKLALDQWCGVGPKTPSCCKLTQPEMMALRHRPMRLGSQRHHQWTTVFWSSSRGCFVLSLNLPVWRRFLLIFPLHSSSRLCSDSCLCSSHWSLQCPPNRPPAHPFPHFYPSVLGSICKLIIVFFCLPQPW